MKFTGTLKLIIVLFTLVFVNANYTIAQNSSGNVLSPYTFYGLGELDGQGTAAIQAMSGTSIAVKNPYIVNTSNPAAYTVAPAQTMLFSFGMMGNNQYLKSDTGGQTSNNNFTLSDLAMQFPIAKNVGAALSYSPYSSVGYKIGITDTNEDYLTDIGQITYNYLGSGGIALVKAGIAWAPIKGLSVGANMINYFGNINRTSAVSIYSVTSQNTVYRTTYSTKDSYINKYGGEIGVQYDVDLKHNRYLTFGAVYAPKLSASIEETENIYTTSNSLADSVLYEESYTNLTIPTKVSFGVAYRTSKVTIAADYVYQDWTGAMEFNSADNVSLTDMHEVSAGFEYTPNKFDLRNHFKRWTYRAGLKASNSYMMFNNNRIKEYSGSIGLGIPLQRGGGSLLNLAAEAGTRGSSATSSVLDEKYFKISIGFTFFTAKEWFVRHKFK
ncbi:MAG: hypothetical protein R3Y26_04550 [Rikenellaceae bacterium]